MSTLSAFNYEGGSKIPEIEITNPIEYSTSVRAKDLNDIANKLNEIIEYTNTINNGEDTTNNNITINGNIISGEISSNIKSIIADTVNISTETTTSGTILSWTIDGKTNSINIENEKWLSSVNYNKTNKTIDFTVNNGNEISIPVSAFNNEYTSNDFSLSGLTEKSYNSLTEKPTISGIVISGSIDNTLTNFVKNIDGFGGENNVIESITVNGSTAGVTISGKTANITIDIPELPTIETTLTEASTNDTVAGSKAVVDYVSAYVENQLVEAGSHTHTNKEYLDNIETNIENTISSQVSGKVDKVDGKGLSTNDFTTAEMNKLSGIEAGAEVNVIEAITVNGASSGVSINGKTANINIDIPKLPTIETTLTENSTNDTVAGSKAIVDYVSGKIEDLNNFDGNYNNLTDKPTISGQTITGEISGSIIPIVDSVISNNIMQTKTISGNIIDYILEHNTFTKISTAVSSFALNITKSNLKAMCLLTTVSGTTEPTISFNYPDTYLINKDITFKNDTTYLIAVENDIILWTDLVK